MKNNVNLKKSRPKPIIIFISVSLVILLFCILIFFTIDSNKIKQIKEFIGTNTKVLYVTNDESLDYPTKILSKYSVDYLKINSNELTIFERKKIEIIINNNLNNILIIYENGNIKDVLIEYKNKKSVETFLQENNMIPVEIVDNVDEIMSESEKILDNTYAMIYIPYKKTDEIALQNEIFEQISKKYSIDYKKIDAYLLSNNQQEKINRLLGISSVENQILILVKDNKMIANIRGIHRKNTYIQSLYDTKFITELEDKIIDIDYNAYKELLSLNKKSVILIGDNNKDTKDVANILNKMIYNYNIEVNYINVSDLNADLYNKVKEKLLDIGYKEGFSIPIVIIVESNKILDYSIGNSKEEYFVDIFIENGVIKGEIINEHK